MSKPEEKYPTTFTVGMENHQDRAIFPMGMYRSEKLVFIPKECAEKMGETEENFIFRIKL